GARVGAATFEPSSDPAGSVAGPAAETRVSAVLTSLGLVCGGGCVVKATYCAAGQAGVCTATDPVTGGQVDPPVDSLLVRTTYSFNPWFGFAFTPKSVASEFVMAMENQRAIAP
ncbi:MAG: hypothetical protein AAF602_26195, partial [Myxococcota bacterium]